MYRNIQNLLHKLTERMCILCESKIGGEGAGEGEGEGEGEGNEVELSVTCSKITEIITNEITSLECICCPNLLVVIIPNLKRLVCDYCPNLTEIQCEKLEYLSCRYCKNLYSIPTVGSSVDCTGCNNLILTAEQKGKCQLSNRYCQWISGTDKTRKINLMRYLQRIFRFKLWKRKMTEIRAQIEYHPVVGIKVKETLAELFGESI